MLHRHINDVMKEAREGKEKNSSIKSTRQMQKEAFRKKGRAWISQVEVVKEE